MSDPEVFLAWLATLVWALLGLFATYWWVLVLLGLWGMLLSVRSDLAATRWEVWEVRAAVADLVQRFEGTQAENDRSPPARPPETSPRGELGKGGIKNDADAGETLFEAAGSAE